MTAAIESVLLKVGVHRGYREKRMALATKVDRHVEKTKVEFTQRVADALYVEAKEGHAAQNPSALVAKWLEDGDWVEMWAEIRESEAHTDKLGKDAKPEQVNQMPERQRTPEERARYDAAWVYSRLVGDRKTVEEISKELRLSEHQVRTLAEQGARDRGREPIEDVRLMEALDPALREKRTREVRRRMARGEPPRGDVGGNLEDLL